MKQQRRPNDIIQPEGLRRADIDRPIKDIDGLFAKAFGWQNTPVQAAARIALEQGEVSIGDFGCGSGNTLRTWIQAIRLAAAGRKVSAVGINKFDYSEQSGFPATRAAYASGAYRYVVADATGPIPITEGALDVSLVYTGMEYCADPVRWMGNMLRTTRPGGEVYFTVDTHGLFKRGDPLAELVEGAEYTQPPMLEHAVINTNGGNVVYMTLGRLVVPGATGLIGSAEEGTSRAISSYR